MPAPSPSVSAESTPVRQQSPRGEPFDYSLYGLCVRSDVRLPLAPRPPGSLGSPAFHIRRIDAEHPPTPDGPAVAQVPCEVHGADVVFYRGSGGAWIWNHSIGTSHVTPDCRR